MICSEVDELLSAFALEALPDDEEREVAAHLTTCGAHPHASSLRAAAMTLSLAADEREPPAALRNRVLGRVATEQAGFSGVERPGHLFSPERRMPRWAPAGALAALLLTVLALWQTGFVTLGRSTETVVRTASAGPIQGRLAYVPAERVAVLTLTNVERPASGLDFQAWVIRPGEVPAPAGVMRVESGTARVTIDRALTEGDVVAVTIEPSGGSAQPTSQPFFTTRL